MKIRDVMDSHLHCVDADDTLVAAATLMRQLKTGSLPVCEENRLVGILTDQAVVVHTFAEGKDPAMTQVRDAMMARPAFIFDDEALPRAIRVMEAHHLRRLPVVDHANHLVGIVSADGLTSKVGSSFP
jgi:CBS domain-containing protein